MLRRPSLLGKQALTASLSLLTRRRVVAGSSKALRVFSPLLGNTRRRYATATTGETGPVAPKNDKRELTAAVAYSPLAPEKLRYVCPPSLFPWKTTAEALPGKDIIGQERAIRAIKLGLSVKNGCYNIYVAGRVGSGRMTTVKEILDQLVAEAPFKPNDIIYVNNFKNADSPVYIELPGGQGAKLKTEMRTLLSDLGDSIPKLLESETFEAQKKNLEEGAQSFQMQTLNEFEKRIEKEHFALSRAAPFVGFQVLPLYNGTPVTIDKLEMLVKSGEFSTYALEQRKKQQKVLSEEFDGIAKAIRERAKKLNAELKALEHESVRPQIAHAISDLKEKFKDHKKVVDYLTDVETALLADLERFKRAAARRNAAGTEPEPNPNQLAQLFSQSAPRAGDEEFSEFQINLLVDNSDGTHRPVVVELNPTYKNLFGAIEAQRAGGAGGASTYRWPALTVDYTTIKPGSLLRANGGYLILNATDTLRELGVWPSLKRALKHGRLTVQNLDMFAAYLPVSSLKPEEIPIDVKVVLIGDRQLHSLLSHYDEEFAKIFKVKAEFDATTPRTDDVVIKIAGFIRKLCDQEQLLPFDAGAAAGIIEHAVRHAGGTQDKVSTMLSGGAVADVVREADYWARHSGKSTVDRDDVDTALRERVARVNLIEEKIRELIGRGTLMVEVAGPPRVGAVNGLSVYDLGDHSFGAPIKISASVGMGREGIINIERESGLSGKTHNKGVLILGGILRQRYGIRRPIAMSASLAFEQSYGPIDGDSASSTEIYCLMSALAKLPLRQDIAITGSVNQFGEIQPIGGVNEKIEGFFDSCKVRGNGELTGTQGVMVPKKNEQDLMLRPDIVDAVKAGRFRIYAIETVDQGIEILTGIKAGQRVKADSEGKMVPDEDGEYEQGTVNYLVDKRLHSLAIDLQHFGRPEKEDKTEKGKLNAETDKANGNGNGNDNGDKGKDPEKDRTPQEKEDTTDAAKDPEKEGGKDNEEGPKEEDGEKKEDPEPKKEEKEDKLEREEDGKGSSAASSGSHSSSSSPWWGRLKSSLFG